MSWKLTHPDSNATVEVDTDSVAIYLSQGWVTTSGRAPTIVGDAPLPSISVPGPAGDSAVKKTAKKK